MRALFLSYDGALDPLGRSQVIPYLEGLSERGVVFDLISYEKATWWKNLDARKAMNERLMASAIRWHPLPYHTWPSAPATAFDLFAGLRLALRLSLERSWDLVHARSYPCSLIAQQLRRSLGLPFIFDMRGLYAEERIDGGIWPENGLLYTLTKRLETSFLRDAAGVVTLTQASLPLLSEMMVNACSKASVRVIPTAVDLGHFRPHLKEPGKPFVLAYFGSLGTWYLLEEMLVLGKEVLAQIPEARLLFVVNGEQERLERLARRKGVFPSHLEIRSVTHDEVPAVLQEASATFFLIKPAPSKVFSVATKFGESLAMGLPVIVNRGVGDSAAVVESDGVGVVVEGFTPADFMAAAKQMRSLISRGDIALRCRRTAESRYDLGKAVDQYESLYREITEKPARNRDGNP